MNAGDKQKRFTLVGALITIAVMGAGLAVYGELASHAAQREKEQEPIGLRIWRKLTQFVPRT
jgi:hypothetical protein